MRKYKVTTEADMHTRIPKRWKATIVWSKGQETCREIREIEEIAELGDIVEGGPDWSEYKVIDIKLEYQHQVGG